MGFSPWHLSMQNEGHFFLPMSEKTAHFKAIYEIWRNLLIQFCFLSLDRVWTKSTTATHPVSSRNVTARDLATAGSLARRTSTASRMRSNERGPDLHQTWGAYFLAMSTRTGRYSCMYSVLGTRYSVAKTILVLGCLYKHFFNFACKLFLIETRSVYIVLFWSGVSS